jgi:hypothetical protein
MRRWRVLDANLSWSGASLGENVLMSECFGAQFITMENKLVHIEDFIHPVGTS